MRCLAVVLCLFAAAPTGWADGLDDVVGRELGAHHIPGLSLAVVRDGKIVTARGFGVAAADTGNKVSPQTLFQAASVSKPVTALGALLAVSKNTLSLDSDLNETLTSWKIPASSFSGVEKVTVRRILSHSAGFNVHGFPGYPAGAALPSLRQILDGEKPANTAPIRVVAPPGVKWQYSGGGYTVLQQSMVDATHEPFDQFMKDTVLAPLGMTRSTFQQPLPSSWQSDAASGHDDHGAPLDGRWHIYPEMAAAGLWTTPSDLGLFIIAIQRGLAGMADGLVSPAIAREMVTPILNRDGMGLFAGENGTFFHSGRNDGFDSLLLATSDAGVVVMINCNDDSGVLGRIAKAALLQYARPAE